MRTEKVTIGEHIARMREASGMTQSALARAAGTSQAAVAQIESGKRGPSVKILGKFAEAIGVATIEMFPKNQNHTSMMERTFLIRMRRLTKQQQDTLRGMLELFEKQNLPTGA